VKNRFCLFVVSPQASHDSTIKIALYNIILSVIDWLDNREAINYIHINESIVFIASFCRIILQMIAFIMKTITINVSSIKLSRIELTSLCILD
jgi:hypothetical protein